MGYFSISQSGNENFQLLIKHTIINTHMFVKFTSRLSNQKNNCEININKILLKLKK